MSETNLGPKVPQQAGAPASSQASAPQRASQPAAYESAGPEPTKWVGWIAFASIMMVMLGTFHMIQGLVALFRDQYYLVGKSGLVVSVNYTTWGWVELIFGAIVLGAGASLVNSSSFFSKRSSSMSSTSTRSCGPTWPSCSARSQLPSFDPESA